MRMWNVNPAIMCRQHLLGEHLEMHMFKGAIEKKQKLNGYEKGLLIRGKVKLRHDTLAKEMKAREYSHKTPMKRFDEGKGGFVLKDENLKVLSKRCKECKRLQKYLAN